MEKFVGWGGNGVKRVVVLMGEYGWLDLVRMCLLFGIGVRGGRRYEGR